MSSNILYRSPANSTLLCLAAGIGCDRFISPQLLALTATILAVSLLALSLSALSLPALSLPALATFPGHKRSISSLSRLSLPLDDCPPAKQPTSNNRSTIYRGALFLLLVAALGACWHHGFWSYYPQDNLAFSLTERPQALMVKLKITGPVHHFTKPEIAGTHLGKTENEDDRSLVRFIAEVQQVRKGKAWIRKTGSCRVTLLDQPPHQLQRGEYLTAFATAQRIAPPKNPGQRDFATYERQHRRLFSLTIFSADHAHVNSESNRWSILRVVDNLRTYFASSLNEHIGEPNAPLANALLLGQREQLSRERRQRYVEAGVIHLLAISGLHVGIIASGIWFLQRMGWLPRRFGLLLLALLIIAYTLLTGAKPPVVRAAVLVLSVCVGLHSGHVTRGIDSLSAGGVLLLIWNPCHLFMLGVQLSFLAVATLMVLAKTKHETVDPLQRLVANTRPWHSKALRSFSHGVGEVLWLGTMVWLVTTPLVMASFQIASPIALILNPLLSLPIATVLFLSILILLLSPIAPNLADATGWLCSQVLQLVEYVIDTGLTIPIGRIHCANSSPLWILGHIGLVYCLLTVSKRCRQRWCGGAIAAWLIASLIVAHQRPIKDDQLTLTVLSIGHGTCVIAELPNGKTCMYDAGCLGAPKFGYQIIAAALREMRIHSLDTLILSHADADHYNVVPELLDNFPIGNVVISKSMFASSPPALAPLQKAILKSGTITRVAAAGETLAANRDFEVTITHPPAHRSFASDNANSLVVSFRFQNWSVLLPGDLEADGMQHLLAMPKRHHAIVMAPHHGSLRSQPTQFIHWCKPSHVIISGRDGKTLDASMQHFRRLQTLPLSTTQGAIRVRLRKDQATISQWKDGQWKPSLRRETLRKETLRRE